MFFQVTHYDNSPVSLGSGLYQHFMAVDGYTFPGDKTAFETTTTGAKKIYRCTFTIDRDGSIIEVSSIIPNSFTFESGPRRTTFSFLVGGYKINYDSAINTSSSTWTLPSGSKIHLIDATVQLKPRDLFTLSASKTLSIQESGDITRTATIDAGAYTLSALAEALTKALNSILGTSGYYEVFGNDRTLYIQSDIAFKIISGGTIDSILNIQASSASFLNIQQLNYIRPDKYTAFTGSDKVNISSLSLSFKKKVLTKQNLANKFNAPELISGKIDGSFTLDIPRIINTNYEAASGDVYEALIQYTGDAVGGNNETLTFYLPSLKLTAPQASITSRGVLKGKLSFSVQKPNIIDPINFNYGTFSFYNLPQITATAVVYSAAIYKGKLIIGTFDTNCKVYELQDDKTWSLLFTDSFIPYSMAVYNGNLYVGSETGRVYKWDGTTETVTTISGGAVIYDLAVYNDKLYAIQFSPGKVYEYDGSTWSTSRTSTSSLGYRLQVYNGNLYGILRETTTKVIKYDGTSWTTDKDFTTNSAPCSLAIHEEVLYASGANVIKRLENGTWNNLTNSSANIVHLFSHLGNLFYVEDSTTASLYIYDPLAQTDSVVYALSLDKRQKPVVYENKIIFPQNATAPKVGRLDFQAAIITDNKVTTNPLS